MAPVFVSRCTQFIVRITAVKLAVKSLRKRLIPVYTYGVQPEDKPVEAE